MWNPQVVIDYLREQEPLRNLSLKSLTQKCVVLLLLATCSRQQRILSIRGSNIILEIDGSISIRLDKVQKHSSRGKSLEIIKLKTFNDDRATCVVRVLKCYLDRTKDITNANDALFCSFRPPYAAIGTPTIARWTKEIMSKAGIDISVYKAHSTRGASASGMANAGVPLNDILKMGSWTDVSTFKHFYLRSLDQ